MLDYLVVGLGLAGISFCETLEKNGKTFKVINDNSQRSSKVAAGLYNPVVLKRLSMAWKAGEQMEMVGPYFDGLEKKLKVKLNHGLPILRRFASIGEQNLWFEACDKKGPDRFLSPKILPNKNPNVDAPFGYGQVLHAGRIDTKILLGAYEAYLTNRGLYQDEAFDHDALQMVDKAVRYRSLKAKRLVFAEGYGLHRNPFFNYLPLNGTKGELLTIKAPELKEEKAIKSSVFVIPLGDDLYRVGATYQHKDTANTPTEEGKSELLKKLDTFLKCRYEVVDHLAAIRPTVVDRRPLVGRHPVHPDLYILNGFGSRGVMIGPYMAKQLFECIEFKKKISYEANIERFAK